MKIGILGLGLIGGSILTALSDKSYEVAAVTRNKNTIEQAKAYTNDVSSDIETLKDCDVIFVCVPMSNTVQMLEKLETFLPPNAIVTDVCSLKNFVMQKKYKYNFIGSHPMAGTENAGFDFAEKNLFKGAKWVLTPHFETPRSVSSTVEELIVEMGAKPVYADAREHDEAAAKISHMPMLIAQALFEAVKDDELAMELAAGGFRDMTRLAMSNIDMAEDMINMNTPNIEKALQKLNFTINTLKTDYKNKITKIREERSKMYDKNGKNLI